MRKIHHGPLAIYLTFVSSFIYAVDFDQTLDEIVKFSPEELVEN